MSTSNRDPNNSQVYTAEQGEPESAKKNKKYSVVVEIAGTLLKDGIKDGLSISRDGCVRP
jgi:hypothetical protein